MEYFSETWSKIVVTVTLATIFVAVLIQVKRKRQKYIFPPGPPGLPIFGNLIPLAKHSLTTQLSEWAYEFGAIYTIHLGPRPAIVVNDVAAMKEIFGIYPASTGKLLTDTFRLPFAGKYGLLCVDGQAWSEQRLFCVKNLKTFGFGKGAAMEPMLIDEVKDMASWLQKEGANGRPVEVLGMLQKVTFNALWTLVTGEKIPLGDMRFVGLLKNYLGSVQRATKTGLAFVSWLKYFAPELSGHRAVHKASAEINQFVREYFEEHQNSFLEGSPRDLIDAYLEQMRKEKDSGSSFYGEEGWKHSVGSVVALFLAGGETTATMLTWLIFYLSYDHEIQRKLQEEIDRVIGKDREPNLKDRTSMPYTEAVIMETLRKAAFLPVGVVHEFTEDTNFQSYSVPKGTILMANLYHVHHDKEIWGDPENFRPERFLDGGKSLKDYVVAMQPGKRQCLGEGLARDIMFLFVTYLFQKFHFCCDPKIPEERYLEPEVGFVVVPKHLPIVASCRQGLTS